MSNTKPSLKGTRIEISINDRAYPEAFMRLDNPPQKLFLIGNPNALEEGIAITGARRCSTCGVECSKMFAARTVERGFTVITGGSLGCSTAAMESALNAGGKVVAFLGGGLDKAYPKENTPLFQHIIETGGAIVSEHEWGFPPTPYAFRNRNRLIASLAKATLVVEAGAPSGTFSLADDALAAGREVLAVPGNILSVSSRGPNLLISLGATPIIDLPSFDAALDRLSV